MTKLTLPSLRDLLRRLPPSTRPVLLALLALAAAAVFFIYAGPGAADRAQAAAIRTLADQVRAADAELTRRLHEPAGGRAVSPTDPLRQLDAAAASAGMRVLRLSPRPAPPGSYDVELDGSFPGLLRFAASIEAPGGALHGLQLHRLEGATRRVFASFTLTIAGSQSAASSAPAPLTPTRDPFALAETDRPSHRLTGITRIGDRWMATIDDRDYLPGDKLDDAAVVSVGPQQAVLSDGEEQTVLRLSANPPSPPVPARR